MAVPTINALQSILHFKVGEEWAFQPGATEFPHFWAVSGALPDGVTLDNSTGLISGAATVPGVYTFNLYATNADGTSAAQYFTAGIEYAPISSRSGVPVTVDVSTGQVFFGSNTDVTKPQIRLKRGDDVIWLIQFARLGVAVDVDVQTLSFAAKRFEPESVIATGTDYEIISTSQVALRVTLDDALLTASLSDEEKDENTVIPCLAEFTWTEDQPVPVVGDNPITRSSRTFLIEIERDLH